MTVRTDNTYSEKIFIDETQEMLHNKAVSLIQELNSKVVEREELSAVLVLTIFSAQNIFLIGKPGVAKTKLLKVAMNSVKDAEKFSHLMMYDTKTKALFGENITTSNGDRVHNKDYTILTADYAFIDEIFKGSSEVNNGLLGITSEDREYHPEGAPPTKVPLKTLFAASNELPSAEVLGALNDRFLLRMVVERIREDENFYDMVQGNIDSSSNVETEITLEEVEFVSKVACDTIVLKREHVESFTELKNKLIHEEDIEASDRRLVGAIRTIMRVSAYLNGRTEVDESDFLLLNHVIWNDYNEKEKLEKAIFRHLFATPQYAKKLLQDAEEQFSALNTAKQSYLNDFLNKKTVVPVSELEEYYLRHIKMTRELIDALYFNYNKHVMEIVELEKKNKSIRAMADNNIFTTAQADHIFDETFVLSVNKTIKNYTNLTSYLENFMEHCPDVRSYSKYDGR